MLAIKTKKSVNAVIEAPPSKSYTNRALIIAGLANGKSVLKNPLLSEDTEYMISALKQFGVKVGKQGNNVTVHGSNGNLQAPKDCIFAGNAGTTMRFVTTLACLANGETEITGERRMLERPIGDLLDALGQLGIKSESNNGFPPVKIYGGPFNGGEVKLKGNVSSQYLSSVLMCAPYAKREVEISVQGELASRPYADVTIDIMKCFGAMVKNLKYKKFRVKNSRKYRGTNYKIEGDASSASYFLAAAAITRGRIRVNNINPNSKQGDVKFADLLRKMGCNVRKGRDFIEVHGNKLKGIEVDMNDTPDIVQTLAVASLFAEGTTTIKNVPNLRLKETDRLRALAFELRKIGANVDEFQDGLKIRRKRLQKAIIETYNDHRMAMSFAVAGLVINGIRIINPACVKKSFPDFWEKFNLLYKK